MVLRAFVIVFIYIVSNAATHLSGLRVFPGPTKTFVILLAAVSISIIFVGDISFGRCVRKYVDHGYNNYNDTMVKVAEIIREADIAVGNLESPFVTNTMLKDRFNGQKRFFLHADHRSATALQ
jgi:hypothetical protein